MSVNIVPLMSDPDTPRIFGAPARQRLGRTTASLPARSRRCRIEARWGTERMTTLTVGVELPRDVLAAMDVSEPGLPQHVKGLLALELFREGRISSGKAAELAGLTKYAFIQLLSGRGVPYFTETDEELVAQVASGRALLGARKRTK